MNRIDRLSAILTQLQGKRIVKASEIAARFDISLRTVYRDIKALDEAGVPIIGEAGYGYSIMEGYRLPPVMFTREEALALLMAQKIAEKNTDIHNGEQINSALYKIKSVLKTTEKEVLDDVSDNIAIIKQGILPAHQELPNVLQKILSSISTKSILNLKYTRLKNQEESDRTIEPVGIYYAFEKWYVIAYCHLRIAYRTFRVDRISSIEITNKPFALKHPSLKDYLDKVVQKDNLIKVVIRINKNVAYYIREHKYHHGFVMESSKNDQIEMTFMTQGLMGLTRWLITFADHVTVVEPDKLRFEIKTLLKKMTNHQENLNSC